MKRRRKLSEFYAGECSIPGEIWKDLKDFTFEDREPSTWFVDSHRDGIKYLATACHTSPTQKEFNVHLCKQDSSLVTKVTFQVELNGGIRSHYKTYNLPHSPTDEEHREFPPEKGLLAGRMELAVSEITRWLSEIKDQGIQFPSVTAQVSNSRTR